MVALLDKSPLPSKTALRARGAPSSFKLRRAISVESRNSHKKRLVTYDASGNRTLKNADTVRTTFVYDNANQLTYSNSAATFGYDTCGNQTLQKEPSGARTTTTWNYENQPALVRLPSGGRFTSSYNPDNRRVRAGGQHFFWDVPIDAYLSLDSESDETIALYTQEPVQFGRIISEAPEQLLSSFYHPDALGSTRAITDGTQTILNSYIYDAWGNAVATSGSPSTLVPFRWVGNVGYFYDSATDLYYIRARVYQPTVARWTSVDPLFYMLARSGIIGLGSNKRNQRRFGVQSLYDYAGGKPLFVIDPNGKECSSADCIARCPDSGAGIVGGPGGVVGVSDPRQHCIDNCRDAETSFNEWYQEQVRNGKPNFSSLPACPCSIRCSVTTCWDLIRGHSGHYVVCLPPGFKLAPPILGNPTLQRYHPGASWDIRSDGDPSQQCTYDSNFELITSGPGVGTVDTKNAFPVTRLLHFPADVQPVEWIITLQGYPLSDGCWFKKYLEVRPANGGKPCQKTSEKHRNRWWLK